ncbi:MAG: RHS repeat-associated core domain-containing protein, partial [Oscillospiraceae bacterium]
MVKYEYDPWGKCTIVSDTSNCNLGRLNSFRYRGYYYDEETSLYYLQSRYYDSTTCLFINSVDPSILLADSYNPQCIHTYCYCNNNPVINVDKFGFWTQKYSGFRWTKNGFNLNVQLRFLSRGFC